MLWCEMPGTKVVRATTREHRLYAHLVFPAVVYEVDHVHARFGGPCYGISPPRGCRHRASYPAADGSFVGVEEEGVGSGVL